jgi:putative Mn2+ efflux pump MntP
MILDSIKKQHTKVENKLTSSVILVQAIATSIDALSIGFTISNYIFVEALISVLLIALVTFFICYAGVMIGKKMGTKLENIAQIAGGIILIFIGIEIFIKGVFFL